MTATIPGTHSIIFLFDFYREYHCFHAKLNAEAGLVDLHVGSPVPNVEHACIKPSFDIDVPFLLATLMPVAKVSISLTF